MSDEIPEAAMVAARKFVKGVTYTTEEWARAMHAYAVAYAAKQVVARMDEHDAVCGDNLANGCCPNPQCMEAFEGEHAIGCMYEAYAAKAVRAETIAWAPTAENVNALPPPIKSYIHDLVANADPAGTHADRACLRQNVTGLTVLLGESKAEVERLRAALQHVALRAYDHGYSAGVHDSRTEDDAARMTRNETIDSIVADALGAE